MFGQLDPQTKRSVYGKLQRLLYVFGFETAFGISVKICSGTKLFEQIISAKKQPIQLLSFIAQSATPEVIQKASLF